MYKAIIILFIFVLSSILDLAAQTLTNNGADLTITNGSSLTINGNFENLDDGSIDNSGDIFLTGDWTNNATSGNLLQGSIGNVYFDGSSLQTIGGSHSTFFPALNINNNVEAVTDTYITSSLNLNNAKLRLNPGYLLMQAATTITGASATSYIVASGNGKLYRQVTTSNTEYPVGTLNSFTPIVLSNNGTADNFAVSVFTDVLDAGTSGTTILEIDHCVNITWDIIEQIPGNTDITATVFWNAGDEGSLFDRNHAGIGNYDGTTWNSQTESPASGSGGYSMTKAGMDKVDALAVGDINSPMAISLDFVIDITALLEGSFNGTSMNTGLNSHGLIPLAQPYNTAPWNYAGPENVGSIPNTNIVDWLLIELRDAPDAASATPASVVGRQAAFLLNNGSIVALDGISPLQSGSTITNGLFVVIYHRNHLSIMSANALVGSGGDYVYNFTTASSKAYGGLDAQNEAAPGIWGMIGGDINANSNIGSADKITWANQTGTYGYQNSDLTFEGQVDNQDKNEGLLQNVGKSSQVPQ